VTIPGSDHSHLNILAQNPKPFRPRRQTFEMRRTRRRPQDSLEVNSGSRFAHAYPPIEHRTRICIRKRELRKIWKCIMHNKEDYRRVTEQISLFPSVRGD
jgi:hypothetical protein